MSINAVSSSNNLQLNPFNRLDGSTVNPASTSADGTAATSAQKPEDNGFFDAVSSALSSIGVTIPDGSSSGTSSTATSSTDGSTSATASSGDAGQALGAFLHQLMGTLHAQGGGQAQADGGDGKVAGAGGHHHHGGGHGGMGHIESDLQSLVQKISSGSSDSTSTDGTASTSSDSSVSGLQSSFANLLTSLGASSDGSNAKLGSFLQSLSGSLEGATSLPTSGNLVNTKA